MGSKRGTALQWLSPPDFQEFVAKHPTATRNVGIKKQYIFDEMKSISDAERIIRFTITNGNVDRDRDVVNPGGLKIDNYLKNPIVLFGHDYSSLPVAKTTGLRTDGNKWVADAQFATQDLYPFADTVFRMVKAGFLNASSIGFRPMEFAINEERHGIDFMSIELLEFSIVPVPAHPEALVEARSQGIDLQPLKDWATRILDEWGQDGALYIPREQAEAVVKIGAATISVPAKSAEGQQGLAGTENNTATPADGGSNEQRGQALSVEQAKGFNPAVFPLDGSYEYIPRHLKQSAKDYLTRFPQIVWRDRDWIEMLATFPAEVYVCIMGPDRPFSEDKVYRNGWKLIDGQPGWSGEPQEINITANPVIEPVLREYKANLLKRGRVLSAANEQKLLQAHGLIGEVCAQVESPSSGEAGPLEIEDEDEEDAIEIVANKAQEGGVLIEEPEPIDLPDVSASDGTLSIDIDHDTLQRAVVETLRQSTASLGSLIERSVDAAVRRARGKVD